MAHNCNIQNLRTPTSEEAREIGRKGGLASAAKRERKKLMRETLSELMMSDAVPEEIRAALEQIGAHVDIQGAILLAQARKAMTGDVEAARFVRDTLGQKPTETFNLAMSDKPIKAVDLTQMSDAEIEALADRADDAPPALPESSEN
jgi:hypothetical protein